MKADDPRAEALTRGSASGRATAARWSLEGVTMRQTSGGLQVKSGPDSVRCCPSSADTGRDAAGNGPGRQFNDV
jgi:hypothetical protein